MTIQAITFYSTKPENEERPFGVYLGEEEYIFILDALVNKFESLNKAIPVNAKDYDWKEWRLAKELQNRFLVTQFRYMRDQEHLDDLNNSEPLLEELA